MGNLGNFRSNRTLFLVVRHVAILGPNRLDSGLGEADVVRSPANWFLVGKLSLLPACIPSANVWERNHHPSFTSVVGAASPD
jgi:hypothetical protein